MTKRELIFERIRQDYQFREYRDRCHKYRQIVAGDLSCLGEGYAATGDSLTQGRERNGRTLDDTWEDIVIGTEEIGRTNLVQRELRTLLLQTNFVNPQLTFPELDADEAAFMSAYWDIRTGPPPRGCLALPHFQMAQLDYMVSGVGWMGITMSKGYPALTHFDSKNVIWDQACTIVSDIQWVAISETRTADYWKSAFPKKNLDKWFEQLGPDDLVRLWFYYDVSGDRYGSESDGTFAVLVAEGEEGGCHPDPLHVGENPFYFDVDGYRMPYLPVEPIVWGQWPSVRYAEGLARPMLAHQMAIWQCDRLMREAVTDGRDITAYDPDAFEDESLQKFLDGQSSILELKTGRAIQEAIQRFPGVSVSDAVLRWREQNERMLTGMSGVNPFASGTKPQGLDYARDTQAILDSSGVVAGRVAQDMARCYENLAWKFLNVCAIYDDRPVLIRLGGVPYEFDADNFPIRSFLRTDVRPVVSEDDLAHKSQNQRIERAAMNIQILAPLAAQFPAMAAKLAEDYLRETGKANTNEYLEQAPQMMSAPEMAQAAQPA